MKSQTLVSWSLTSYIQLRVAEKYTDMFKLPQFATGARSLKWAEFKKLNVSFVIPPRESPLQ